MNCLGYGYFFPSNISVVFVVVDNNSSCFLTPSMVV